MPDFTYVYALQEPDSGYVRYVGKSVYPKTRLQQHLKRTTSPLVICWVEELAERGLEPKMVILEAVPRDPERSAYDGCAVSSEAERKWSMHFADKGHDLFNAELDTARRRAAKARMRKVIKPRGIRLA